MIPPRRAALGIAAIYQQPSLFPDLTVAENIAFVARAGRVRGGASTGGAPARGRSVLLDRVGASIDPPRLAGTLRPARAAARRDREGDRRRCADRPDGRTDRVADRRRSRAAVRGHSRRCVSTGVGVIYISHRLEEVFAIADRVTVLRDGATVATHRPAADVNRRRSDSSDGRARAGRALPEARGAARRRRARAASASRTAAAGVRDISLSVRRGEIRRPGRSGRVQAGASWPTRIFGLTPADAGEILIGGEPRGIDSPARAIRHRHRLRPERSAAARRDRRDVDRREHQPGESARGLASRLDSTRRRNAPPPPDT